ncbi:indoleamine 2,3-dioxygenase family protein [Zalerion maritima]|uniref:Indoleamine 2,3-dioxygenase family protein n=1 Tax=Zalerion maritima TaxID=339359 RepID=A0AAD5RQD8_9PEZI|nr:indoleamine 2,3-dioxygenase family protein [Zalerion maritima]
MGSLPPSSTPPSQFPILTPPLPTDPSLPPFLVSTTRGFLPRVDPPSTLPPEFSALESILQRMPVKTVSGSPGLLATYSLGENVSANLPDLTEEVDKYKDDLVIVNALYRDYSFVASAYLLEPCHESFVRGESYGLARDVLPKQVARPIVRCAEILHFKPFMEYAGSYALYNYRLASPSDGMAYDNLRLVRAFEKGMDPTSSEAGFVLVHIEMVKHSGPLVAGAVAALSACSPSDESKPSSLTTAKRHELNEGLARMYGALSKINEVMETMWTRSKPGSYTSFRTFIFGITSQSMFPRGVLYEGVFDSPALPPPAPKADSENINNIADEGERGRGTRLQFRGESGANDSIVPLCDNLLQISMPSTPLTEILRDFRSYRPSNHRQFLEWVKDFAGEARIRDKAVALGSDVADVEGLAETRRLWLLVLDKVREFRYRHWCFAREYIIKKTTHPTATGGSPIVTWLPNQLEAVLGEMTRLYAAVGGDDGGGLGKELRDIMHVVTRQKETLMKEVEKYCAERGVKG